MHKNRSGFTLLEIIVVVGIVAALSTLAFISFRGTRITARDTKRLSDFSTLATALQTYYQQNGTYPTVLTNGAVLQSPDGQTTYLKTIPTNPAPRADNGCPDSGYAYTVMANNKWFEAVSCLGQGESGSDIIVLTPDGLSKKPNARYSRWLFNEGAGTTVTDSGNLSLPLSLIGSTAWEPTEDCKEGACLALDGTSGAASVTLPAFPRYTVSTWVKRLSNQTVDWEINETNLHENQIFNTALDNVGLTISYYSESDLTLTQYLFFDRNAYPAVSVITSSVPSRLNVFDHVAITSDGTTRKLYVNGTLEGSAPIANPKTYPGIVAGGAKIGEGYLGGRNLNAALDDFRIYDRALSAHEITRLYGGSL